MESPDDIKKVVRKKYGEIAKQSRAQNASSCCGSGGCCSGADITVFSDDYSKLDGYVSEADLGLGCGIPTEVARIKEGDTVVDLGSGVGNDVFVARRLVGETGKVIGIDTTEAMIEKANKNKAKLGYNNVEFHLGDIENMPVDDKTADVVISNCVLNLVPDKNEAFKEIFRILKPGGHFSISDIVLKGQLPKSIAVAAEMYVGCVAGAVQKDEYLEIITKAGFREVAVVKEKTITIPDMILSQYLDRADMKLFKSSGAEILSVTVFGKKPDNAK